MIHVDQRGFEPRVKALMTACREREAEIKPSRTHAAHLVQSVLKEGFAPAAAEKAPERTPDEWRIS